jgi:hypothetical protein
MAAMRGMHVRQHDVKTAFLNAPIEENVHDPLPPEADDGGSGGVLQAEEDHI